MKIQQKVLRKFILNNKAVLILFLSALFIRLIYLFLFNQFPLMEDDRQYDVIAKNILDGNGFSYDSVNPTAARGPFYPLFLAATYFIFGDDYNTVRILQAVLGALTCLLIYFIAKELHKPIGFYACAIASFYPSLIGYSGLLYSETLAAFLLSLSIFIFIASFNKKSAILFVITGICLGLLILCYPKFLFLPAVFLFSSYYFVKLNKNCIKYFLALMLGVFLTVTPWTLRNFNEFGKFIPVATGAGTTLWYSTLPQDNTEWYFDKEPVHSESKKFFPDPQNRYNQQEFIFSVKTNEIFMQKALNNIKGNPLMFINLSVKRFFRQWLSSNSNSIYVLRGATGDYILHKNYGIFLIKFFLFLLQMYIIIFGLLGMLINFNLNKQNIFSPVLLSIIYSSFINSIFMTSPRYQIPVLGLLFIYTALGSHEAFSKLSKTKNVRELVL